MAKNENKQADNRKQPKAAATTPAPQLEHTDEFNLGLQEHPADPSKPYIVLVIIATILLLAVITYWLVT